MTRPTDSGFSLIELCVALVVVGLLLGMLTPGLAALAENRRIDDTRQTLAEAREALFGFAIANGRLPRPAASVSDGTENPTSCANDQACTGLLPWQTLATGGSDAWGKRIRYSVTPAFANAPITLQTVASKKIQTRDAGDALAYLVGSASSCSTSNPCAAAVLYSAGKSSWGTLESGSPVGDASSTNLDEDVNESATTRFIARPFGTYSAGGEFDDLVIWLPTTVLAARMAAAGRLP